MNKGEAAKLLSLIKLSYPTSYRDIDRETAEATVNMWAMSFNDVPYPLVEQAFNAYRMTSKFPPTVAEIAEQLRLLHYRIEGMGDFQRQLGRPEAAREYYNAANAIRRFRDWPRIEALGVGSPMGLLKGGNYGTSGNHLDRADGLSLLDAGDG